MSNQSSREEMIASLFGKKKIDWIEIKMVDENMRKIRKDRKMNENM